MDSLIYILLTSLCAFFLFTFYFNQLRSRNKHRRLPRAGGALPIIGHLHHFGGKNLLHRKLAAMAEKFGSFFTIKLGSQEYLVISSLENAKECFTTLDRTFSDRPTLTASKILGYNCAMFGIAPYGPYWRQMRKIAILELLSHRRIDMLAHIRASELQSSLKELCGSCIGTGRVVADLKQWFGDMTLNTFVRMVGGKRFAEANGDGEKGRGVQKVVRDLMHYLGVFVLSDAIPSLAWLDLQGHQRNMKRIAKELDDLMGEWLEEHKQRRKKISGDDEDFMDAVLTAVEARDFPDFDADTVVKATCMNMIVAGSDTIMVTLTWALSLLLNNPHSLKKAQEEVDAHIGKDRQVNESDIKNLVYLEAVVKETLRLYPATPVISLRSALEDCTLSSGHHVPSGTRLLVNVWNIQRNPDLWPEPHEFRPERFLTSHKDIDITGHNFELIPFGSGRRSCPGISLALQMVHLTLASLLHCFELSRPGDAEIDMVESNGLTNMKDTLEVCIAPRVCHEFFSI